MGSKTNMLLIPGSKEKKKNPGINMWSADRHDSCGKWTFPFRVVFYMVSLIG